MKDSFSTKQIAFLGNHVPRRCGIATFTASLCEAVATKFPKTNCTVLSVNDYNHTYNYPPAVSFELAQEDTQGYERAAEFINFNNIDVVSIQHEFGIYGGEDGAHLLKFLKALRVPAVMTLHTILKSPKKHHLTLIKEFDRYCQRFVVMAEKGRTFLETIYGIAPEKIDLIPHGVMDIPFIDPNFYKDLFDVQGKTVLLTFGLLSPNKGIENVIKALPSILKKHPEVVYIILGETHPGQVAHNGEKYREELVALAKECHVSDYVLFFNKFVTTEELKEFIGAADIYITPYCNEAQITSGTLAYTFGAGKALISTPYWHAQELLENDRGILVPFNNSKAIAEAVNRFLEDPALMTAMRKNAWNAGREMIWPVAAEHYMDSFEKARMLSQSLKKTSKKTSSYPIPKLNLTHLFTMSDLTGLLQHANYTIPNLQEGYCLDDNARAFILMLYLQEKSDLSLELNQLMNRYLAFLAYAFNHKNKHFRNFMSYEGIWLDTQGSDDSAARALWALGTAVHRSRNEGHRHLCSRIFQLALPSLIHSTAPRSWAFTLLALDEYLHVFQGDRQASQVQQKLTQRLLNLYKNHSTNEWQWFENCVTYDNPKLSHALIATGVSTKNRELLEVGLTSLRWILKIQLTEDNIFSPIGCHGFWKKGEEKARFDQQPLEAYAMVSACLAAFESTKDLFWKRSAMTCFEWFLGNNELGFSLYDPNTGGCCDGLQQDRLNANQGAESSLSFYLAHTEISHYKN